MRVWNTCYVYTNIYNVFIPVELRYNIAGGSISYIMRKLKVYDTDCMEISVKLVMFYYIVYVCEFVGMFY